ncbi:NrfD/PsrC family molybdoenzyme membrane anchor subunit [Adlercreutzia sp. R25]|uniref:NrfD/PsrC family molybdoenzyme membrane anchor subunit n=1 Tax=Adlercreutzia shanghongiae TaxID=3111773 RepID=UPI002DBE3387|nr:NrfD/PsrC family molybdoenzyme membrane anchor subunit [Adlercreutzia sp. R25]MEC4273696.1 NrfD/PsrC family molybdoenzyme membrane anchor subunit [Adlercreutzia sp. R25]
MLQLTWSWQPALYLFLGGMGAGAFIMAAVLFLIDRTRHRLIVCVSMWAGFACLAVGLMLLLSELITPVRGMLMWQSFSNFASWMTYGAWGAFGALAVFALSALLAMRPVGNWLAKKWKWFGKTTTKADDAAKGATKAVPNGVKLRTVLAVIGIALAAFVAVYTGMLLMTAGGVPLWDSPLLPCLFTVSALDTGVALVEVIAVLLTKRDPLAHRAAMLMERIVIVLVVLEMIVLGVFLGGLLGADPTTPYAAAGTASAELLATGGLSTVFWGMVVACGLVLPLVMAALGLALRKRDTKPLMALGAIGALIGGCELRFLVLAAGVHADVLASTVMGLIL